MWTSEDSASSFKNVSLPYYVYSLLPHPSEPSWVLYTAWTDCCLKSLACTSCKALLLGSEDKGASWITVTDYLFYRGTQSYGWAPAGADSSNASIAFVAYAEKTGDQRVKLGEAMNLYLQSDFRVDTSLHSVIANGGPFYHSNNTYMVARVSTGRPGLSQVMVSRNYGDSFKMTNFPSISSFDAQREWLHTASGNPFLGSFDGPEYTVGNVFVSPGKTKDFTLALQRLVHRFSKSHWTHIGEAIPGTYIANAHPTADGLTVATVISYNHGGTWHPLVHAGSSASNTAQRVHLSAPYPGPKFHAPNYAPGLIVAAGQIGPLLTSWSGERVLVSRDAGRSWNASLSGSFVVYGANGGTVMLATDDSGSYSSALHYSLNFGTSWTQCDFAPFPVRVISMRPNYDDHYSPIVIIDAKRPDGTFAILTLNITGIYDHTCLASDFTPWDLVDEDGNDCVFGMRRTYARRRPQALCQKLSGQARLLSTAVCRCSEQDFVCSYCYKRNAAGACDFMWNECLGDSNVDIPETPDNCTGTFELDDPEDAYILSPDSFCRGGMEDEDNDPYISCPPPVIDNPPPPFSTLQGSVGVTIAAIALALCGILIVALYYGGRNLCLPDDKAELIQAWKNAPVTSNVKDEREDSIKRGMEFSPSDISVASSSDLGLDLRASGARSSPSPLLAPSRIPGAMSDEDYVTLSDDNV